MSAEQYNAMQMCRIPRTQDKELQTEKNGYAFFHTLKKEFLVVHKPQMVQKPRMDASSSSITVSQQATTWVHYC